MKHENSQDLEYLGVSLETDSTLVKQVGVDYYSLTRKGLANESYVFKHRSLEYGSRFMVTTVQNDIDLEGFEPKGFTLETVG